MIPAEYRQCEQPPLPEADLLARLFSIPAIIPAIGHRYLPERID
jgi:hypothetical protein